MGVTASKIMTREVICVQESATIQELVALIFSKRVSGVPVLDGDSKLAGIVSKTDLVTHGLEQELSSILGRISENTAQVDLPDLDNLLGSAPSVETVSQIMTTDVVTASPSSEIREIVRMMLEKKIHRVVITKDKKVIGIVTSMDLLRLLDT
jgi:CBS domain-containing protein